MRFMVLVKADKNSEMGKYNEELVRAGVLLAAAVFEAEDFGPALTPELREAEERLRAQIGGKR